MQITELDLSGVFEITPRRFEDSRGHFSETFKASALREKGVDVEFVQDNRSLSREPWTVRGLHFQLPPFEQAKLVSVLRGSVLDIAVDIRRGSPTFGRHVAVTLTAEKGNQLLIPAGFAHAFCTLEPDVEVAYKVSNPYAPTHEGSVLWNDPTLDLPWPITAEQAKLSDKDAKAPLLADAPQLF